MEGADATQKSEENKLVKKVQKISEIHKFMFFLFYFDFLNLMPFLLVKTIDLIHYKDILHNMFFFCVHVYALTAVLITVFSTA